MDEYNNFTVVRTTDGILQTEDGICLQNKEDGKLYFVPPSTEILAWIEQEPSTSSSVRVTKNNNSECDEQKRTKWSKDAILTLIQLRIQYDREFRSTTSKNEVTWKKVAQDLKGKGYNITSTQCNDKWRYLKARYTAKKDNMGDKGTGEQPIDFPYFDEMDSFLGQKHNIKPIAIASSIQGNTMRETETEGDDSNDTDGGEPPRKKKISNVTKHIRNNKSSLHVVMEQIKQSSTEREQSRERRHQENLMSRDKAINVFSEKMDSLIDTLKK